MQLRAELGACRSAQDEVWGGQQEEHKLCHAGDGDGDVVVVVLCVAYIRNYGGLIVCQHRKQKQNKTHAAFNEKQRFESIFV